MKPKNMKNTQKARSSAASGSALERKAIKVIREKAKGTLISIRCWTPSTGSAAETHATTITDAVKFLRGHAMSHANFELRMVSEPGESLDERIRTLSAFARTAPGKLPQAVQDALSPWEPNGALNDSERA